LRRTAGAILLDCEFQFTLLFVYPRAEDIALLGADHHKQFSRIQSNKVHRMIVTPAGCASALFWEYDLLQWSRYVDN
jgi:hypothetical protein